MTAPARGAEVDTRYAPLKYFSVGAANAVAAMAAAKSTGAKRVMMPLRAPAAALAVSVNECRCAGDLQRVGSAHARSGAH